MTGPVMIPAITSRRIALHPLLTAYALLLALAAVFALPSAAAGQEGGREEVRHIGAHDIRVLPTNLNLGAGSAQYSILVTHPETGEPVPGARVMMLTGNQEDDEPGWAYATNSPADPQQYNAHLKLDSTGQWTISVDVSSSLGADFVEVGVLEVPSVNRLTQGTWVFVGVFALILGGIAYVWWSARRDYRRKQAARADSKV